MKVSELIADLQNMPQDSLVVISRDSEGNGFSPCDEAGIALYLAESTWSGDLIDTTDPEVIEEGIPEDGVPAVCLWPVN